jgi:hypothetical protein
MRQPWQSFSNPLAEPGTLRKYALTAAGCALFGALSAAAAPAWGLGRLADVEVVDRADGRVLPVYAKDGRHWVVGTPGREYAIRIRNAAGARVLAVTSVDGVNVVTGETASPSQSGYVLDGYGNVEIAGWRKSLARTASFYFTELPDAYAARTGRPDNVGVIGVALFRERPQPIARPDRVGKLAAEAARDSASPAPAAAPEAQGAADTASRRGEAVADERTRGAAQGGAPLGTGHGRSESSRAEVVRFERDTAFPAETITIHYDRRENLVAMGVLPPPVVVRAPEAFPASLPGFVADPPRR